MVKQLRDATNVSMMECKRALQEAEGDYEKATRLLRERGMAVAAKKASRAANQGLIAAAVGSDGVTRSLVEVNCETDFVARNATFQAFVQDMAERAAETDASLADTLKEELTAKVAEIGENLVLRRNVRFVPQGEGVVASYIHLGGKVGVLVEVSCEKAETKQNEVFRTLVTDLTLHVAACSPQYLRGDEVPEEALAEEREIFAKQVEGKPPQILDKIVEGKIRKYLGEICFLDQGFVKEPKQSVTELLEATGKAVGDTIGVRRYVRYQIGQ
jgi:elongation factor Ts